MDEVNADIEKALADLAANTLQIIGDVTNALTGIGDLFTAAGLNPSVQGTGDRLAAGGSFLLGVVASGPKLEAKAAGHLFREAAGHVNPTTASSRARYTALFEAVASKGANRNDAILPQAARNAGMQGFTQVFNGGQVWVHAINGKITNAGVNLPGAFR